MTWHDLMELKTCVQQDVGKITWRDLMKTETYVPPPSSLTVVHYLPHRLGQTVTGTRRDQAHRQPLELIRTVSAGVHALQHLDTGHAEGTDTSGLTHATHADVADALDYRKMKLRKQVHH